jgi:glycosyltransferase involved in cell wall biosynthesis
MERLVKTGNASLKIDVAVCTYESERYLDECLTSIEKTVPFDRLIVVDRYSKDRTAEIARKHKAEIYLEDIGLGHARQVAIENSNAPLLLFVDADVVFYDDKWFHQALSLLTGGDNIGAVGVYTPPKLPPWRQKYVDYWWKNVPSRKSLGFSNVYFFRRKAIEGIKIPNQLGAYEQVYLRKYVQNRGYKVVVIEGNGIHYYEFADDKGLWMGAGERVYIPNSVRVFPRTLMTKIVAAPFKAVPPAIAYRDPWIIVGNTRYWLKYLRGWVQHDRYIVLKRR